MMHSCVKVLFLLCVPTCLLYTRLLHIRLHIPFIYSRIAWQEPAWQLVPYVMFHVILQHYIYRIFIQLVGIQNEDKFAIKKCSQIMVACKAITQDYVFGKHSVRIITKGVLNVIIVKMLFICNVCSENIEPLAQPNIFGSIKFTKSLNFYFHVSFPYNICTHSIYQKSNISQLSFI